MKKIVAAIALLALIGYGWRLLRQVSELDQRVSIAEQTNQTLAEAVDLVREQAEQNLNAFEAAEQLERRVRAEAAAEASRAAQAEQDRAVAEGAQQRAQATIAASESAGEQATAAAERQRRERREEWQRLGSALRKIAPSETGAARHQVDLTSLSKTGSGTFDSESRETLSRLAGVLLANYGYAARLNGTGAQAIGDYLTAAGVPSDALSVQTSQGADQLVLFETVLAQL